MNIEQLKKKKQLNVQEQNALKEEQILKEAEYWRKTPLPLALQKFFQEYGIDVQNAILVDYSQDFPGCSTDEGIILTSEKRFFKFELDFIKDKKKIREVYVWKEITDEIEISGSKPGIGTTWGYLALKVLNELNNR